MPPTPDPHVSRRTPGAGRRPSGSVIEPAYCAGRDTTAAHDPDQRSGDTIADIQRALNVLDRFGRTHGLPGEVRTALRMRMMSMVDGLEIELAKRRILEGNFAAARYHLGATRERPWKVRAVLVALRIAPRVVRAAYLRLRPSRWGAPSAAIAAFLSKQPKGCGTAGVPSRNISSTPR